MRIVIDTNVLISGIFFGGFPRQILSGVVRKQFTACATAEIIDEYEEIVQEMITRKQGHLNNEILTPLINAMEIIEPVARVKICRDPDDDKFLGGAKDSRALYIVSGDKDLWLFPCTRGFKSLRQKTFMSCIFSSLQRVFYTFIVSSPAAVKGRGPIFVSALRRKEPL